MIKYNLICNHCSLTFDSWFASSTEYEKLRKKKFLSCHSCNSTDIKKSLMAPSLINKRSNLLITCGDISDFSTFNELQKLQLIRFIFFSLSNSFEELNQLSNVLSHCLHISLYLIMSFK